MSTIPEGSVDKLVADLQLLVSDAEAILQETAADAGERATAARTRIRDTLREARAQIERVEQKVVFEAKVVATTRPPRPATNSRIGSRIELSDRPGCSEKTLVESHISALIGRSAAISVKRASSHASPTMGL